MDKKSKKQFVRGQKYSLMLAYANSLGYANVTDAIIDFGSGRKFRNSFNISIKYKKKLK